ncbi:MAG: xanthine dehydrogenase accessory protein XdhC [Hyphomicrobiales bacterium]|nr:xanthine dehydrogenase accessory protein XdhC [Hyphomicrobiales bacterium]
MTRLAPIIREALASGETVILVTIHRAEGSTPREKGATMLVTRERSHGTIGGGQLEFHATDVAREMIGDGTREKRLDLPLGPHLGQCCGGRVELLLRPADHARLDELSREEESEARAESHVLLFGAGHVGLALAHALAPLPLAVTLLDDRDAPPPPLPEQVTFKHLDDPEGEVEGAPAGSAFLVLTHSHALDYRLADAALRRDDARYVGMIGSATKRARFERWFLARGGTKEALSRFICPIGGKAVRDKRPAVIAAVATAEILMHLLAHEAERDAVHNEPSTTHGSGKSGTRVAAAGFSESEPSESEPSGAGPSGAGFGRKNHAA